jgi:hypothetical protein
MSSYRDDSQDTAIISDTTWVGLKALIVDTAKIVTGLSVAIAVIHTDSVVASDEVFERQSTITHEVLTIDDEALSTTYTTQLAFELANISDSTTSRLRAGALLEDSLAISDTASDSTASLIVDQVACTDTVLSTTYAQALINETRKLVDTPYGKVIASTLIEDTVIASDVLLGKVSTVLVDTVQCSDQVIDVRKTQSFVLDQIKVAEFSFRVAADVVQDDFAIADLTSDKLRAYSIIEDTVIASDILVSSYVARDIVSDSALIADEAFGHLIASDTISDVLWIDDILTTESNQGYAWTANTDNWAMSRYDAFAFDDLSVLDGVLYGVNADGVFRLDATTPINASVTTGKLDLGQGQLVHPIAAYMEYELSGVNKSLQVGVSTTQNGAQQTYFYPLPNEVANYLTNGRVLFGRGLRGRHFAFVFNISAESGYINDLSIDMTATKRRV